MSISKQLAHIAESASYFGLTFHIMYKSSRKRYKGKKEKEMHPQETNFQTGRGVDAHNDLINHIIFRVRYHNSH